MPPPLGFPPRIQFSSIAPGAFAASGGGGLPKHTGNVIVRIAGDASAVFSVSSLETQQLVRDPDAPPHSPLVWETVLTQNGAGPISLEAGDALIVMVRFACPANPAQARFSGTAIVQSDDASATTLLQIPIDASVLAPSVTLESLVAPTLSPGAIANFGFRIASTFRQELGGTLTCDSTPPTPFTSDTDPQFPILSPGGSLDVTLPVRCAPGTAIGNHPVVFRYRTIDNAQVFASLVVNVTVTEARSVSLNPSLPPHLTLEQGSSTLCEVRIAVSGGATTFNIQPVSVPNGITLTNGRQSTPVNGSVFLGIDIDVDPQAPPGKSAVPLVFNWSVPADDFHPAVTGSLAFTVAVTLVTVAFVPQDDPLSSGEVQASAVRVAFASNGDWTFSARLHDFSSVFGDNFALGFAFNFTDGRAHGPAVTGVLGSSLTRNPESLVVGVHQNDPWLRQNWQKAFASGGIFRLHHSGDLSQVLSDLGDDFKNAAHEIYVAFTEGSDCPIDPQTDEPSCPDPGTGDGGEDGVAIHRLGGTVLHAARSRHPEPARLAGDMTPADVPGASLSMGRK